MSTPSIQTMPQMSLSLILNIVWRSKIFIICFTTFFSGLMVMYAVSKPNLYTVEGLYMSKGGEEGGSLAKLAGQFGGLASMAGVQLGGGSSDKTEVALELLKSRAFLQTFINKYNLTMPLIAVKEWDEINNKLIIDPKLYDEEKGIWVRVAPKGKKVIPTAWESYPNLVKNLSVDYVSKKGMLTIKLTYFSPVIAAKWLDLLVKEVNIFWQKKTQLETEKYIRLLHEQTQKTNNTELLTILYSLIGEQTKTLLLNNISDEVMFETVAPIIIPEDKSAPSRAFLCLVTFIFSSFISVLIAAFYGLNRQAKIAAKQ
jgi:uncharacterized protein involved in exopolysaccharide biosynthesis